MTTYFVFGSNEAGRHGKGAAAWALKHRGAIYGQGVGAQGRSYAIPTKDKYLRVLDLKIIQLYIDEFITFAKNHPDDLFELTPVGCGLAGFRPSQIAPLFKGVSENVVIPPEFAPFLKAEPNG